MMSRYPSSIIFVFVIIVTLLIGVPAVGATPVDATLDSSSVQFSQWNATDSNISVSTSAQSVGVESSASSTIDGFENANLSNYDDVEAAATTASVAYTGNRSLVITDRNDDIYTSSQGTIGNTISREFDTAAPSRLTATIRADGGSFNTVGIQWQNSSNETIHGTRILNYHNGLYYGGKNHVTLKSATSYTWYRVELVGIDWEKDTVGEIHVNNQTVATNVSFVNPGDNVSRVRIVVHDGGTGSKGWFDDITIPSGDTEAVTGRQLSFEEASPGASSPADPWQMTMTEGQHRISDSRATHGNQSLYLAGSSGLGQSRAAIPVDLTGVAEVRSDIYVESSNNVAGDIKIHVDNTSNMIIGTTLASPGQWYSESGNTTQFSGHHNLILRTRGSDNRANFDNIRFYDAAGNRLPPEEVVDGIQDRLTIPFSEKFDTGLNGWTVDQRFRTGDKRIPDNPTPGDGGYVQEHGGSVRLHVDGDPSTIGVARNTTGISAGTNISATYLADTSSPQPGAVRIAVYAPDGDDNAEELVASTEGKVTSGENTIAGTVKNDYPNGTEIRVLAGVWPGEYTAYVTDVQATVNQTQDHRAVSITPANASLTVGGTQTFDVVLENATEGSQGYDVTVSVSDTSVTEITGADTAGTPGLQDRVNVSSDGSSVNITAGYLNPLNGSQSLTLATVTVEGTATGSTDIAVESGAEIRNGTNQRYTLGDFESAQVSISQTVTIPGRQQPAQDVDGDGFLEDIDGDGKADVFDAIELANNANAPVVQNNPRFFDFDGDGKVDIFDAIELANEVRRN